MQFVDYYFNLPEETIAFDEELLKSAESGQMGETLRFWESKEYFVVIGRAGKASEDCFLDRCREDGIKIIRRVSGGGTVLQGPGCLNYSLILSYDRDERFRNIRASYEIILIMIMASLTGRVSFHPISDLAFNGKKFSGNAQARKKKYFLHHGTILYDFNLDMIPRYLKHPIKEPEYRNGRTHKDFLTNIPINPEEFKEAVKREFL
ncbi:MAG: lipoate--protein ligase family protein [Candidatus Omnitrophota bacterium]